MSNEVICDKCGQTGMFITPGTPCLRRFADGSKVCHGTMIEQEKQKLTPAERQADNRLLRKAKGICRQCSNKLAPNSVAFCEMHLKEHREKARLSYVSKNN